MKIKRICRFSLRFLLVAMAVLAIVFGFFADRAKQQRDAVQWIEENGGTVTYRYEYSALPEDIDSLSLSSSSVYIGEPPIPGWVLAILDIHYFYDVTEVNLWECNISAIDRLIDLPKLEYLDVRRTNLSDEQIETLKSSFPTCHIYYREGKGRIWADPFER